MFLLIFVLCLFALWGVYFLSPVSVFLYCDDLSSDILCRQLRFLCLALLGSSKRRPGGQTRSMLMRRIVIMVIRMWLIEESDCSRLNPMYCTYYLEVMHSVAASTNYRHMGFLYFIFYLFYIVFFGIWQWHMHWQCCILVFNTCTRIAGVCWCGQICMFVSRLEAEKADRLSDEERQ